MTDDTIRYTDAQRQVLSRLPASAGEIAEELELTTGAIRGRIYEIREKGGFDTIVNKDGVYYYNGDEKTHRISSRNKGTVTRKANEHLTEVEQHVKNLLRRTEPTRGLKAIPDVERSEESVVIHRSDDHIGQVVCDDRGREIYNVNIATARIRAVTQRVMELIARERTDRAFDAVYLLLGGDTVTGENIYDYQPFHIEKTLDKQIRIASELYYEQIELLAEVFDEVIVVCQSGNHGEIRANGSSQKANADDIAYSNIDLMVRVSDLDNVHVERNDATKFINFRIRDHRAHLRHGQDSLCHIGTSSGRNRWRGWKLQHKFDIAYRGHFHEFSLDHVYGAPVIMSGSPCPPGDFEESLSLWSSPAATLHGVTDDRPLTWLYPIDFDGQHDIVSGD